ncbi:helix-turn-helix domain-containing protein, partial [Psychrobacter aestuarii]|uniref:helix-turn-helix domain-containing protein n=1 Tax=Psychrobacter aestuarii TaxID=556327 RepID=UPI001D0FD3E5
MLSVRRLIDLARLETGSYKEVANRLNTSNVRITHWRNGRNAPSAFEIYRMAEIARLEPEKTFYDVMSEIDKE